jgi:hypothetical protein
VHPSLTGKQVSAEDTYAEYSDLDPSRHNRSDSPLGIKIIERTYKWTEALFYNFIIYDYQIINIGLDSDGDLVPDVQQRLSDVHVGIRIGADISTLAGGEYWYDDLVAYDSQHCISYIYDGDDPDRPGNDEGEYGVSPGYLYARMLNGAGGTPYVEYTEPVSHTWWTLDNSPNNDELKFSYMATPNYAGETPFPYDYQFIQSSGPFQMEPDDTLHVVWALGIGLGLDGMLKDSEWAKRIYDAGYITMSAPPAPNLTIERGAGFLKLMWDNNAENSQDPFTGEYDFEGYRLYKSSERDEDGNHIWIKLVDFDEENDIGSNTGLKHEYIDSDIIAGYSYSYAVTAYDRGIPGIGINSLESDKDAENCSIFLIASGPGRNTVDDVYAYPNPFIGAAEWESANSFHEFNERKLAFANLPLGKITIKIFTLAGDLVDTIKHDGAEFICFWDLCNKKDRPIVSGIYIYAVESQFGNKIGKFIVLQ